MILIIDILLMWSGCRKCMQIFINRVIGIVEQMVNMFYGFFVSVFIMMSVSIVRMMIIIRKQLNRVIEFGIGFIFCLIILFSEVLLCCEEINSIMKFCIVFVSIMLVSSYRVFGRQFICVVSIGLISGLVLVIVVKWWLNSMQWLVGIQFRLLLLMIVGVECVGLSFIIFCVMYRL